MIWYKYCDDIVATNAVDPECPPFVLGDFVAFVEGRFERTCFSDVKRAGAYVGNVIIRGMSVPIFTLRLPRADEYQISAERADRRRNRPVCSVCGRKGWNPPFSGPVLPYLCRKGICNYEVWRPMPTDILKAGDVIEMRYTVTYHQDGTSVGPSNQEWRYKKPDAKTYDSADRCSLYG